MDIENRLKEIHAEIESNIQTMDSVPNDTSQLVKETRLLIREFNQLFEIFVGGAK